MRAGIDSFPYSINFADLPYIESYSDDLESMGNLEGIDQELAKSKMEEKI